MSDRPRRADARRNYDLLVRAAREAIGEHGPDIALDDVARRAGVGSGTLYRHFPTKHALVVAAYAGAAEEYAAAGRRLLAQHHGGRALHEWLRLLVSSVAECRGLGAAALATVTDNSTHICTFHEQLHETADLLLADARQHDTARPDISATELLTLANAIASACEGEAQVAERLFHLAYTGISSR